jgi:hypothetical protein
MQMGVVISAQYLGVLHHWSRYLKVCKIEGMHARQRLGELRLKVDPRQKHETLST